MSESSSKDVTTPAAEAPVASQSPAALRVVLLADDESLRCYGPVLRRLAVGLIDEVGDLSLLCQGSSKLLSHVPSPPVRLITETPRYNPELEPFDFTSRQISILTARCPLLDTLRPHQRVGRVVDVLSQYKPTLLHALCESQVPLAQRLSRRLKIPYVVSLLSMTEPQVRLMDFRCGAILACDSSLAQRLRQLHSRWADNVHVLPIGTHVTETPCCFSHGSQLPSIFCCGALDHGYGLTTLINTIKRLSNKGHSPLLTLSGEGPAEHDLRQQVAQLGLVLQVHFAPPIDTMISASDAYKPVLRDADIFAQPWPSKHWRPELLESMSVGNAVVVADGVANDLVINEKTALEVPFQDEQSLTAALDKLLTDRPYAVTLGQNAQDHLRQHFLASEMISRLAQAYRQAQQIRI